MEERIKEKELVLPALYLIRNNGGFMTTSDLIKKLEEMMHPTGIDAEILDGRNDTYFSQKVRNLKSHATLSRQNYATDENGGFRITQNGADFVTKKVQSIEYLLGNDFEYSDVKASFGNISQTETHRILIQEYVSEGGTYTQTREVRERSVKLRNAALDHFRHDGILKCDCCGFEFKSFYGDVYGVRSCIEIHHLKPIFLYEERDMIKTIEQALQNLLPVCPNCHRVIHKNHITMATLPDFKNTISELHNL